MTVHRDQMTYRSLLPVLLWACRADAGHEVQIFLTSEATYLMRKATAAAILRIRCPPLIELCAKNRDETHSSLHIVTKSSHLPSKVLSSRIVN